MAYVINDSCVSCGTCAGECPVNAISQGDGQYVIDADTCISCGTCAGVRQAQSTRVDRKRKPIHKSRCSIRTAAF